jgi:hypothetical protein
MTGDLHPPELANYEKNRPLFMLMTLTRGVLENMAGHTKLFCPEPDDVQFHGNLLNPPP